MNIRDEFFFEFIKICHENQFKRFEMTQHLPEVNKIKIPKNSQGFEIIHEWIHKELMGTTLGCTYITMNQIYEILVDCFCTKLYEERKIYWPRLEKMNKSVQMFFGLTSMEKFWKHLSQKDDFIKFIKFSLKYRKRYMRLLDYTHVVQEGTATYIPVHFEFPELEEYEEWKTFREWQVQQRLIYQQPEKIKDYYEPYNLACRLAEIWGQDSVFLLAYIAMSPPVNKIDIIGCSDKQFKKYLKNEFNCDVKWRSLLEVNKSLVREFSEKPEDVCDELYKLLHKTELTKESKITYFEDKKIIKVINQFMGKTCFHDSLLEYYDPSCKYPLSFKPMSYVDTEKNIKESKNFFEFIFRTIIFHRKYPNKWNEEDWDGDPESILLQKADKNEIIHCENITNLMEHILELGGNTVEE